MTEHRFSTSQHAYSFMMGGNAYLTLRSLKTQARYTYRIKKARDREIYFVSTLYGPNNNDAYSYVGLIREGRFELNAKRKTDNDPRVAALRWAWQFLTTQGRLPTTLEVWHEGRCASCGRRLTVPSSIESGFGPECIKKAPEQSSRPSKIVY